MCRVYLSESIICTEISVAVLYESGVRHIMESPLELEFMSPGLTTIKEQLDFQKLNIFKQLCNKIFVFDCPHLDLKVFLKKIGN